MHLLFSFTLAVIGRFAVFLKKKNMAALQKAIMADAYKFPLQTKM